MKFRNFYQLHAFILVTLSNTNTWSYIENYCKTMWGSHCLSPKEELSKALIMQLCLKDHLFPSAAQCSSHIPTCVMLSQCCWNSLMENVQKMTIQRMNKSDCYKFLFSPQNSSFLKFHPSLHALYCSMPDFRLIGYFPIMKKSTNDIIIFNARIL